MPSYMLDTNVFNDLLKQLVRLEDVLPSGARFVVTHVQRDELDATPDAQLRECLLARIEQVAPEKKLTTSAVWGASRWDEARWPAVPGRFEAMLAALDARRKKANNANDILIAETALHFGHILMTADNNLLTVFQEFGGSAVNIRTGRGWDTGDKPVR